MVQGVTRDKLPLEKQSKKTDEFHKGISTKRLNREGITTKGYPSLLGNGIQLHWRRDFKSTRENTPLVEKQRMHRLLLKVEKQKIHRRLLKVDYQLFT